MNLEKIARLYAANIRSHADAELDWFRSQPNLETAVKVAAQAMNSRGKRYSHQYRITHEALNYAEKSMFDNLDGFTRVHSFDDLITMLDPMLRPYKGLGELYVYDTSLRLGAKLGYLPEKIYL